jgi:hypothetical protein
MQDRVKGRGKQTTQAFEVAAFAAAAVLLWIASSATQWWAYDFGTLSDNGGFVRHSAIVWVREFGLVITALLTVIWIVRSCRLQRSTLVTTWTVFWQSTLILCLYAAVIIVRRQTWSEPRGVNDWAMFFGTLNARFFSEVGPLIFVLAVIPAVSIVSALLFYVQKTLLGHAGVSQTM